MSTTVMAACWPLQMSATEKAVLISLADNANDHGECWPALATIAERTCLHRATVIRAIEGLERRRYIVADRSNGRHSRYTITPRSDLFNSDQSHSATGSTARPVAQRDPSLSATTGSTVRRDPSHSATGPVAQRDTNRKEPSRTVTKSNRQGARTSAPDHPQDVPESTWMDWLALRKAKRAPVSETVITQARAESAKAGMSFADFLAEWCVRGSQGLKAEWITGRDSARGPPRPPIAQQFSTKTYTGTPTNELPDYLRT